MLAPGPASDTSNAIITLLGTFPSTGGNDKARANGFRIALEDLPAWAIEEAVKRWLRGEDGEGSENYAFAPSPPQLRRLALRARALVELRLRNFHRLLQAEVLPIEGPKEYVDEAKIHNLLASVTRAVAVKRADEAGQEALAQASARIEADARASRLAAMALKRANLPDAAE